MMGQATVRAAWMALAFIWFVSALLGHLEFSLWLVRERGSWSGSFSYKDYVPGIALAAGLALLAWLLFQLRAARWRSPVVFYWIFWWLCVFLVDRTLTFSPNEYAHYPQYALLAWLVAKSLDPERRRFVFLRVVFWATLAGMIDETAQYLWITISYSDYLDFNDFLVNLLASIAGAMLYYGFKPRRIPSVVSPPRAEILIALLLLAGIALGSLGGRIAITPSMEIPPGGMFVTAEGTYRLYLQRRPDAYAHFSPAPYHGRYWVLEPWSGVLLMGVIAGVFGTLPRVVARAARR